MSNINQAKELLESAIAALEKANEAQQEAFQLLRGTEAIRGTDLRMAEDIHNSIENVLDDLYIIQLRVNLSTAETA